jgi:hypothetical protein
VQRIEVQARKLELWHGTQIGIWLYRVKEIGTTDLSHQHPSTMEKPSLRIGVVYPWVYPQTCGTHTYPYLHGRVWVFTGMGMGKGLDT